MKKTMLLLFISLVGLTAFSQPGNGRKTPQERAKEIVTKLNEEIQFSEETLEKMNSIMETFYTEAGAARAKQDFTTMRKVKDERDKAVKALLSEEDYGTFLRIMEENRPQKRGGKRPGPKK